MTRDRQINFRLSEDEAACFERVAGYVGLPVGAMIRMLVRREDEALAPRLTQAHRDVLRALAPGVGLLHDGIASNLRALKLSTKGLPETLYDLTRWNYLSRNAHAMYFRTKLAEQAEPSKGGKR